MYIYIYIDRCEKLDKYERVVTGKAKNWRLI